MTAPNLRQLISDTQRVRSVCSIVPGQRIKALLDALEVWATAQEREQRRKARLWRWINRGLCGLLSVLSGAALAALLLT